MSHNIMVELAGVSKRFGPRCLFTDLNASLAPGQCLAVVGPNGTGKSTLIKIIAGLVRPSAGAVRVSAGGREICPDERAGRIGFVSPEVMFYSVLSGCENIAFLTSAAGVMVSQQEILSCCRLVDLAGRENDKIATYSTGMRQRLKFALVLALQPSLWLLDEPSSNLDAAGKQLVAKLIRAALADKIAVVIASNGEEEAGYAGKTITLA